MACVPEIQEITAVFVRFETTSGQSAWGCCVANALGPLMSTLGGMVRIAW